MLENLVDRIGKMWDRTSYRSYPATDTTTADAETNTQITDFPVPTYTSQLDKYISNKVEVSNERRENYKLYNEMDEHPLPSSACDIYADNATQLGMSSDSALQGKGHVIQFITDDDELRDILSNLRDSLKLDQRSWSLARDIVKIGEVFEEVVVTQDLVIDRLKQLPPERMIRNENKYGILEDDAYLQISKDDPDKIIAKFEDWEVLHFKLQRSNEDKYGTSVLKSVRSLYKKLEVVEQSMLIARLSRANMRMAYYIDTGGLPAPAAFELVQKYKKDFKKTKMLNRFGQFDTNNNPLNVDEDIFMGVGENSKARVEQLYGDLNIGNLTDVNMFINYFFAGVKIPKSYMGLGDDVQGKSTLSMQDIQFARSIRRIQLAMRNGYRQLCDLELILRGKTLSEAANIKPLNYQIGLPSLQTVDELREWELRRVQAEVARIYEQELYMDPVTVMVDILGFSEADAAKVYKGSESDFYQDLKNRNALKSYTATSDKKLGAAIKESIGGVGFQRLQGLRDLTEWSLEQIEIEEQKEKGNIQ